jgi:hypothetical protein
LNCHDGSVAQTDLNSDFSKLSTHDVRRYDNIHDLKELPGSTQRHVECVDCHNPHSIESYTVAAPIVPGSMKGVQGVTISGSIIDEVQFEYEVCLKCHGDNPDRVTTFISRQITQTNSRLEFNPSNPSYHPVAAPGANQNVPSLKVGWDVTSVVYCTDCHGSDGSGTAGPHGSNHWPLLKYRYETSDFTPEDSSSYELCYQCHSRNSILNDESFDKHEEHLKEDIPCSACHDAHGISSAQGSSISNSHLINFDLSIVNPDPNTGQLEFRDDGLFRGTCWLECHGKKHSPKDY